MNSIAERHRSKTSIIVRSVKSLAHSTFAIALLMVVAGLPIYLMRLR